MTIPQVQAGRGEINQLNQLPFNPDNRTTYPVNDITIDIKTLNSDGSLTQTPVSNIQLKNGQTPSNTTAIPLTILGNTFDENVKPVFLADFTYVTTATQTNVELVVTVSSTAYPEVDNRRVIYLILPQPAVADDVSGINTTVGDTNTRVIAIAQTVTNIQTNINSTASLNPVTG